MLPLYLFSRNNDGVSYDIGAHKIYYAKIWDDNNSLVRDFIPVKDPSGVVCLYDKVSGNFFYNAGTGNFIAGPDL